MDFGLVFFCFLGALETVFVILCVSQPGSSSCCQGWQLRVPSLTDHAQGRGLSQAPGVAGSK